MNAVGGGSFLYSYERKIVSMPGFYKDFFA